MLLADLVGTSSAVAATAARSQKVARLADLLRRVDGDEVDIAVAFLTGEPRQGRIGVGWATVAALPSAASEVATLTLTEVDRTLDRLQALSGPGSASARAAALADLMGRATADEGDFLRRLLTGELRQGALAGVMVDAVAKAAEVPLGVVRRACMLAGDLGEVAQAALSGGEPALAAIGLEPLRPVQPMLATSAASMEEALVGIGTASIEWKLDGARVQAHRLGDEVRLFTRNLNDVTSRLPAVVAVLRRLPAEVVILDGEVLGVGEDDRPDRFQDSMSRFSRQEGGAGLGVWFFDCMHLDGVDLIDRALVERQAALDRVAGPAGVVVPRLVLEPTDDGPGPSAPSLRFLDEALAAGHEGVMVKAAASSYAAGRRGSAWRKVKPVQTFDLVVLAVEWGSGRRRGWLSNLHLGARQPGGGLVMVGKTFKGLTDELLAWQTEQLLARQVEQEGHVVRVRPELVVEIALDGVQRSTRYPGGVALRFARVRRYRLDKAPDEADTIDALRRLLGGDRDGTVTG